MPARKARLLSLQTRWGQSDHSESRCHVEDQSISRNWNDGIRHAYGTYPTGSRNRPRNCKQSFLPAARTTVNVGPCFVRPPSNSRFSECWWRLPDIPPLHWADEISEVTAKSVCQSPVHKCRAVVGYQNAQDEAAGRQKMDMLDVASLDRDDGAGVPQAVG